MNNKKALCISGGGSKGAYGGGIAQHLIEEDGRDYDLYLGTSTGNLLCPLLAVEEIDKLKKIYTSVDQDDIWSLNPFKVKKNGLLKMNLFNIARSLLKGNRWLGETDKFRDLINEIFTSTDYEILQKSGKEVVSCVTNFTIGKAEFKSNLENTREEFMDWMYASSCVPPFMKPLYKNSMEYVDGGLTEHVPIQEAINRGATDIDVIELKQETPELMEKKVGSVLEYLLKSIKILMKEVSKNDYDVNKLRIENRPVRINMYYATRKLTNNSLVFRPDEMKQWWDEGYYVAGLGPHASYLIDKKKIRREK